jgi:hypothetical protein
MKTCRQGGRHDTPSMHQRQLCPHVQWRSCWRFCLCQLAWMPLQHLWCSTTKATPRPRSCCCGSCRWVNGGLLTPCSCVGSRPGFHMAGRHHAVFRGCPPYVWCCRERQPPACHQPEQSLGGSWSLGGSDSLHEALKCCGLRVQREVEEMQHGARSRAVAAADIVRISEGLLEAAGTWESKLSLWKQVRLDMHFPHGLHPKRAAGGPFRPWIQQRRQQRRQQQQLIDRLTA